jgi:hypothetical protein
LKEYDSFTNLKQQKSKKDNSTALVCNMLGLKSLADASENLPFRLDNQSTVFPPGMKLRGGQIIILLNFLVKITNIAYFWPFKGGIFLAIQGGIVPPSGGNTESIH